jgi:hypothetical protein
MCPPLPTRSTIAPKSPGFDFAYRIAGGDEIEITRLVEGAADNIEAALTRAHLHKESATLKRAVQRLGQDIVALLRNFSDAKEKVAEGLKQ